MLTVAHAQRTLAKSKNGGSLLHIVSGHAVVRRHAHQHRTIQVQLKADVPGLGPFGSIHTVNPGRMRNHLFPKGLANYVLKGVEPPILTRPSRAKAPSPSTDLQIDYADLRSKIHALPCLVIPRRVVRLGPIAPSDTPRLTPIYGSVTPQDILHSLSQTLKLRGTPLSAPNVSIVLPQEVVGKMKSTGKFMVQVHLKDHASLPLQVVIEAEKDV